MTKNSNGKSNGFHPGKPEPIQHPSPTRVRLPKRRPGMRTIEGQVAGHRVIVTTGEHEDGTLGEIFINTNKEGSPFQVLMKCFAVLTSLCLQHGVPLALLVERFEGIDFAPHGQVTGHPEITEASSIIDFVFKALRQEYLAKK